jgi:hypothetical protein
MFGGESFSPVTSIPDQRTGALTLCHKCFNRVLDVLSFKGLGFTAGEHLAEKR